MKTLRVKAFKGVSKYPLRTPTGHPFNNEKLYGKQRAGGHISLQVNPDWQQECRVLIAIFKENVKVGQACLKEGIPSPTVVVKDGDKQYAIWLFDQAVVIDEAQELYRDLAAQLNTEIAMISTKVPIPGTYTWKTGWRDERQVLLSDEPEQVELVSCNGRTFSYRKVRSAIKTPEQLNPQLAIERELKAMEPQLEALAKHPDAKYRMAAANTLANQLPGKPLSGKQLLELHDETLLQRMLRDESKDMNIKALAKRAKELKNKNLWLIEGLIRTQSLIEVYGQSGIGKSTLVRYMVSRLLTGTPCFGLVTEKAAVSWFTADEVDIDLVTQFEQMGLLDEDSDVELFIRPNFQFSQYDRLQSDLDRGVRFFVFDSYSSCSAFSGVDPTKAAYAVPMLRTRLMLEAKDAAGIIIHHPNKGGNFYGSAHQKIHASHFWKYDKAGLGDNQRRISFEKFRGEGDKEPMIVTMSDGYNFSLQEDKKSALNKTQQSIVEWFEANGRSSAKTAASIIADENFSNMAERTIKDNLQKLVTKGVLEAIRPKNPSNPIEYLLA